MAGQIVWTDKFSKGTGEEGELVNLLEQLQRDLLASLTYDQHETRIRRYLLLASGIGCVARPYLRDKTKSLMAPIEPPPR
jgi:hypothetical protein